MEIRNKINERHFNLEIYEWDDFTLDMLKSYSDWKCNGNQTSKTTPVTIEKQPEVETEDTVKINVNTHVKELIEKEEVKGEKKHGTSACGIPLFEEKDLICKSSKYNSVSIYQPVLNYILTNIDIRFTKKEIAKNIFDYHKILKRHISPGSSEAYASAYMKYMIDEGIVREMDGKFIRVHKKKTNIKNMR